MPAVHLHRESDFASFAFIAVSTLVPSIPELYEARKYHAIEI